MHKMLRKILRVAAHYDPDYYDMRQDGNEHWFARLYLERIRQHAEAAGIRPPARVLEAGCQAGRLVIPLAQQGFEVTGVDTSSFGLRRARQHAKAAGVRAAFVQGDIRSVLRTPPSPLFDVVICAEVVYLSPHYRQILEALARATRPGGLLFVSHRPKFYYLLEALRQYDMDTAAQVASLSEGRFRDSAYYNWQTEEELRQLYASLGLRWRAVHPIDRFAWLGGLDPSAMTEEQRGRWLQMELQAEEPAALCGRYALVVAERPKDTTA